MWYDQPGPINVFQTTKLLILRTESFKVTVTELKISALQT